MNGYNFTERVRRCLACAREEAARLRHGYVAPQHILLGMLREGEGVAAAILNNRGIDVKELEKAVIRVAGEQTSGAPLGPDLPYTSRAKKVLELAMTEARNEGHSYVGTEHLLLGLIQEGKGVAAETLLTFGLTYDVARDEMRQILQSDPTAAERERQSMPMRMGGAGRPSERLMHLAGKPGQEPTARALTVAMLRNGGRAKAALRLMSVDTETLAKRIDGRADQPDVPLDRILGSTFIQRHRSHARVDSADVLVAILDFHPGISAEFAAAGVTAAAFREMLSEMEG